MQLIIGCTLCLIIGASFGFILAAVMSAAEDEWEEEK